MDGAITKKQSALLIIFLLAKPELLSARESFHIVKAGESLSGIAERHFGRTINVFQSGNGALARLLALNPQITDPRKVAPGQKIFLVKQGKASRTQPASTPVAKTKKATLPAAVKTKAKPVARALPTTTTVSVTTTLSVEASVPAPAPVPSAAPSAATETAAETPTSDDPYPAEFFTGTVSDSGPSSSSKTTVTATDPYPPGFFGPDVEVAKEAPSEPAPEIIVEKSNVIAPDTSKPAPTATVSTTTNPYPDGFLKGNTDSANSDSPVSTVTDTSAPYPFGFLQPAPEEKKEAQIAQPESLEDKTPLSVPIVTIKKKAEKTAERPANPDAADPMNRYPPGFLSGELETTPPAELPAEPVQTEMAEVKAEAKAEAEAEAKAEAKAEVVAAPVVAPSAAPVQMQIPAPSSAADPMDRYPPGFLKGSTSAEQPEIVEKPRVKHPHIEEDRPPLVFTETPYGDPMPSYSGPTSSGGSSSGGSYSGGSGGSYTGGSGGSYSGGSSSGYYGPTSYTPHSRPAPTISNLRLDLGMEFFQVEARDPKNGGGATLSSGLSPMTRLTWNLPWNERWAVRLRFHHVAEKAQASTNSSTISNSSGNRYGFSFGAVRHWNDSLRTGFSIASATRMSLRSTGGKSVNADRAQSMQFDIDQEMDLLILENSRAGAAATASIISGGSGVGYTSDPGFGLAVAAFYDYFFEHSSWEGRGEIFYGSASQKSSLLEQNEQHLGLFLGVTRRFE